MLVIFHNLKKTKQNKLTKNNNNNKVVMLVFRYKKKGKKKKGHKHLQKGKRIK